jgi:hypothetical protein
MRTFGHLGSPRVRRVEYKSGHASNLEAATQKTATSFPTGTILMPPFQTASALDPVILE